MLDFGCEGLKVREGGAFDMKGCMSLYGFLWGLTVELFTLQRFIKRQLLI